MHKYYKRRKQMYNQRQMLEKALNIVRTYQDEVMSGMIGKVELFDLIISDSYFKDIDPSERVMIRNYTSKAVDKILSNVSKVV